MMKLTKLDKVFSEYIRRRDADHRGFVKCCTCPTVKHWKKMDAGHYVRRGSLSVRFDEMNCHAQCVRCNRYEGDGMGFVHMMYIMQRYGDYVAAELKIKGRKSYSLMQHEIDELTEVYKSKLKQL